MPSTAEKFHGGQATGPCRAEHTAAGETEEWGAAGERCARDQSVPEFAQKAAMRAGALEQPGHALQPPSVSSS